MCVSTACQVPTTKVVGLHQRRANRPGNVIVPETRALPSEDGGAWSNRSRSASRTVGPPDGRPNPEGARLARGHGQNSVHTNTGMAQPPAALVPSGKGFHAGLRMVRRRGHTPDRRSGFLAALGMAATSAFVGRSSRGTPSQSAVSSLGGADYRGSVGLATCYRRWVDGPRFASSHDERRGLPPRISVSLMALEVGQAGL